MMIKIISVPFNSIVQSFDDSELCRVLKGSVVFDIRDYFFIKNEIPYLTFVVKYALALPGADCELPQIPNRNNQKKYDESWKLELKDSDLNTFNILRQWRKQRSEREGIPPYILLTNRQLVLIVKSRPQTLADLEKIDGFGKSKLEKYGTEILSVLREL